MLLAFAVLLGLALLAIAARRLNPAIRNGTNSEPVYEATAALMTPAERSFFGVLQQVVPENFSLFAKVRLADLIQPRASLNNSMRQSAFNKISSKHIDFILCESATTKVVCAVELDDSSHHRGSRQARDSFVDAALQFAGIPVVRFSAKHGYQVEKIRGELAKAGVCAGDAGMFSTNTAQPDEVKYMPHLQPTA